MVKALGKGKGRAQPYLKNAERKQQALHQDMIPGSPSLPSRKVSDEFDTTNTTAGIGTDLDDSNPIYTPHGKWAFMAGRAIEGKSRVVSLSSGRMCSAHYEIVTVEGKSFPVIVKEWDTWRDWEGFYSELYLYASSKHLRPLQGTFVPNVIGVVGNELDGVVSILMEPPHGSRTGWTEAHPVTTPHRIKIKIIKAYQAIHKRGVLHNDVELRHILITDDEKICIIDWQLSRSLYPNPIVDLQRCTHKELEAEMRKVKYLIDFKGAREKEDSSWINGGQEIYEKNRLEASKRRKGEKIDRLPDEDWDVDGKKWFPIDPRPDMFEYKKNPARIGRRFLLPPLDPSQDNFWNAPTDLGRNSHRRPSSVRERSLSAVPHHEGVAFVPSELPVPCHLAASIDTERTNGDSSSSGTLFTIAAGTDQATPSASQQSIDDPPTQVQSQLGSAPPQPPRRRSPRIPEGVKAASRVRTIKQSISPEPVQRKSTRKKVKNEIEGTPASLLKAKNLRSKKK